MFPSQRAAAARKAKRVKKPVREQAPVVEEEEIEIEPEARQKLIVVIEGAKSQAVRGKVEKMLAEQYELVPAATYKKTAKRLKARKMIKKHLAKVAGALDADVVVHGVVKKRGKRLTVAFKLHDGATGAIKERVDLTFKGKKIAKREQRELEDKLMPALAGLQPAEVVAEAPKAAVVAEAPKAKARVTEPEPEVELDEPAAEPEAPVAKPAAKPVAKPAKAATRVAARDEGKDLGKPKFRERFDDRGQVIDNDMPDILR